MTGFRGLWVSLVKMGGALLGGCPQFIMRGVGTKPDFVAEDGLWRWRHCCRGREDADIATKSIVIRILARRVFVKLQLGARALSVLFAATIALLPLSGCNSEETTPAKPAAPEAKPAAPATPPPAAKPAEAAKPKM